MLMTPTLQQLHATAGKWNSFVESLELGTAMLQACVHCHLVAFQHSAHNITNQTLLVMNITELSEQSLSCHIISDIGMSQHHSYYWTVLDSRNISTHQMYVTGSWKTTFSRNLQNVTFIKLSQASCYTLPLSKFKISRVTAWLLLQITPSVWSA